MRLLVVDAANVVGSRPDGWWRDRAGAARRLLTSLAALHDHLPRSCEVVVVLEGAAKAAIDADTFEGLRVVHAAGSGDDAIVAVVAQSGDSDRVLVVTADRGLRDRVEDLGTRTTGPRWLLDRIDSVRSP